MSNESESLSDYDPQIVAEVFDTFLTLGQELNRKKTMGIPKVHYLLGLSVLYTLTENDAKHIHTARAGIRSNTELGHHHDTYSGNNGTPADAGMLVPAHIVAVRDDGCVGLQVRLDGNHDIWVQKAIAGYEPGQWFCNPNLPDPMRFNEDKEAELAEEREAAARDIARDEAEEIQAITDVISQHWAQEVPRPDGRMLFAHILCQGPECGWISPNYIEHSRHQAELIHAQMKG